jgi:putative transposase
MKYEAIKACKNDFCVRQMCKVLGVSSSAYYDYLQRKPCLRLKQDKQLSNRIKAIAKANRYVYGVPRIHAELKAQGIRIGRKRVSRLMKTANIRVKTAKPFKPCTTKVDKSHRFAPNLLNRDFKATAPKQKWLCDITYIPTREGFLYVAAVEDLFSRRIVGLAMDAQMPTGLVERAFIMATQQHKPQPGLLHHTDRGSQYSSKDYQQRLRDAQVIVSMSRTGNCLDNAPIESFWSTLKRECATGVFATRAEARASIFDYIMTFYNRTRRHSTLGYLSPEQFEKQFLETKIVSVKTGY